jgi:hypothetical protein
MGDAAGLDDIQEQPQIAQIEPHRASLRLRILRTEATPIADCVNLR